MPQIPSYIRSTSMVICITIMILGVIGNIMVPIVILKTKDMRNSTNIFLTNLSIADLLVLLVCTPTVLVEVNSKPETWVLGYEMCKAVPFIELTVAHASVLTILAISFERYYAICEPLKAGYVCTKTRALLICVIAWTIAAIFTSPILSIAKYDMEIYIDGTEVAVCLTSVDTFWPAFYFIITILLFFVIPFLILLILYSIIAKHLMNNSGIITHGHRSHTVLKYRKQVIFMLGTVVLSFFLCLLPFRALTLWIIIVPSETIMSLGMERYYNILYFCRIMMYLNSAMNPILYNLMSTKFRDGFLKLLGCGKFLYKKRHPGTDRQGTFHTTSTNMSSSSSSRRDHHWQHQQNHSSNNGTSTNNSLRFNRTDSISSAGSNSGIIAIITAATTTPTTITDESTTNIEKSQKILNKIVDSVRRTSSSSAAASTSSLSDDDDTKNIKKNRNGINGNTSTSSGGNSGTNLASIESISNGRRLCKKNFDDIKEESDDDEQETEQHLRSNPKEANQFHIIDCASYHHQNGNYEDEDDDGDDDGDEDELCEYGIANSGMEVMACIIPHYGRLIADQTVTGHFPSVINKNIDSLNPLPPPSPPPLGITNTESSKEEQMQLIALASSSPPSTSKLSNSTNPATRASTTIPNHHTPTLVRKIENSVKEMTFFY